MDCNRCGDRNWSKQHECPARRKNCVKCGKIELYAKGCRCSRKINLVAEEETYRAEGDDWTPDKIHSIHQKIHSLGANKAKRSAVLYSDVSGQNQTNQIHNRHGLTSDSRSKIKTQ